MADDGGVLYLVVSGAPAPEGIPALVAACQAAGWRVVVFSTPTGTRFIDPAELEKLTGEPVRSEYRLPGTGTPVPAADAVLACLGDPIGLDRVDAPRCPRAGQLPVPEAFRNFLALLGWTPPEGIPEVLSDEELIRLFGLDAISKSNAVFDRDKLDWFNTEYIRAYPAEKLLPLVEEEWKRAGVTPTRDRNSVLAAIDLLKARARNLKDFAGSFRAFFTEEFEPDPAAVEKFLKDASVCRMLVELGERYAVAQDFSEQGTEKVLRDFAAEKSVKAGALINGARVALTGQGVAPSLFGVMSNLGKERTTQRLKNAPSLVMTPAAR